MTVTIWFTNGTQETFSNVTFYDNDGNKVLLTGTDSAGVEAGWEFNWSSVWKVQKIGSVD